MRREVYGSLSSLTALGVVAMALGVAACAVEDETYDELPDVERAELLDALVGPDGTKVSFFLYPGVGEEDFAIGVQVVAEEDSLDWEDLIQEGNYTPLEVFAALAPEEEPPPELVTVHRLTSERDGRDPELIREISAKRMNYVNNSTYCDSFSAFESFIDSRYSSYAFTQHNSNSSTFDHDVEIIGYRGAQLHGCNYDSFDNDDNKLFVACSKPLESGGYTCSVSYVYDGDRAWTGWYQTAHTPRWYKGEMLRIGGANVVSYVGAAGIYW